MATPMVKIWVKKKLHLEPLTFRQQQMVEIGSAGLLSVFRRLSEARGPTDAPAKPLTTEITRTHRDGTTTRVRAGYAIQKSRKGRGNRRNLFFSGQLLGSLKIRSVDDSRVRIAPGGELRRNIWTGKTRGLVKVPRVKQVTNRDVATANQKIEPWVVFSPENQLAIMAKAREVFARLVQKMVRAA